MIRSEVLKEIAPILKTPRSNANPRESARQSSSFFSANALNKYSEKRLR